MIVRRLLLLSGTTLAGVALVIAGIAALSREADTDAAADAIRVTMAADIRGTNPGVTRDGNTDTVIHHVVEALVAYGQDLEVAPLLAETISVSADHRTYSFTLRDGVRFHNGAPLTSAEVKWSWQRMLDPKTGFRCRNWYDGTDDATGGARIVAIDTPDPRTVVFRLNQPNGVFLHQMAHMQCVTAILHPSSVAADGSWIQPVGTGPFRLAHWKRGEYVDLVRFDGYRPRPEPANGYAGGRRPLAPKIRFLIVPEASVGEAALRAGDIDIAARVPLSTAMQVRANDKIRADAAEQLYLYAMLLQTRDPLLRDPRVRRAIAHAINSPEVAAIASHNFSIANPSVVPRSSPYHSAAEDEWWPYDPAKARRLLEAAGYDGQPVRIQTNRKFPQMFENAVAVQAMLVAVGFDARLEVLDWTTQLANYFSGDFQISSFGFSGRTHPILNYAAIVGDKAKNPAAQWDDHRARVLLSRLATTAEPRRQQAIVDALHALMREQVPLIALYNERSVDLVRPEIRGYSNWSLGHPRLWGVERAGG